MIVLALVLVVAGKCEECGDPRKLKIIHDKAQRAVDWLEYFAMRGSNALLFLP
jgi:hypothetical protein